MVCLPPQSGTTLDLYFAFVVQCYIATSSIVRYCASHLFCTVWSYKVHVVDLHSTVLHRTCHCLDLNLYTILLTLHCPTIFGILPSKPGTTWYGCDEMLLDIYSQYEHKSDFDGIVQDHCSPSGDTINSLAVSHGIDLSYEVKRCETTHMMATCLGSS